jgi:hypothetical protein
MNSILKVEDGQVVSMDYTLRVDGEVVELGRGEWDLCYPSSPKCVYPPKGHRYFVFDQGVGATVERCYSKEHGSND